MILAVVVAAAATVAAPPSRAESMPNLYSQPSYCRPVVEQEVARQNTAFHGRPPAVEYAVLRKIEGCGVPTPIGYHPSLEPGAADPTVTREDAPSNRR
ncbi:MAG TPA: hypothetical protein VFE10_04865 [Phenylobacterium sp.]|jgi:hypothetical protein|nr:hypothetical protein [Phenylobacterium sp.]